MKLSVHKANISDVEKLSYLFDGYRQFYKQDSDRELAKIFLSERINQDESVIFYVKNEQGEYLGFTQLYPSFSSVSAQRTWILNDLYVNPEVRSSGVGTMLLNQAKDFAKETGAKGVGLETERSNVGAQKLYESLGYQKDQDHFFYFLGV